MVTGGSAAGSLAGNLGCWCSGRRGERRWTAAGWCWCSHWWFDCRQPCWQPRLVLVAWVLGVAGNLGCRQPRLQAASAAGSLAGSLAGETRGESWGELSCWWLRVVTGGSAAGSLAGNLGGTGVVTGGSAARGVLVAAGRRGERRWTAAGWCWCSSRRSGLVLVWSLVDRLQAASAVGRLAGGTRANLGRISAGVVTGGLRAGAGGDCGRRGERRWTAAGWYWCSHWWLGCGWL